MASGGVCDCKDEQCKNAGQDLHNYVSLDDEAIAATSIAALRALEAEGIGLDGVSFVAGHSLGEYSALVASGALSLAQAVPLVRFRAQAMQEAVPVGVGAMAAILGMDAARVISGCAEAQATFMS